MSELMVTPQEDRIHAFEDFLANDPDVVCGLGRQAYNQGKVSIETFPASTDFFEGADTMIRGMQKGFVQGQKSVCIFVHAFDHTNHYLEYFRVMVLYAQARLAAGLVSHRDEKTKLAQESVAAAEYFFFHPEHFKKDFACFGKIPFQHNDNLMVMGTSPLYEPRHARRSPVSAFVITRMSDGDKARIKNKTIGQKITVDAWNRTNDIPHAIHLPYILPNNLHFADPRFQDFLHTLLNHHRTNPGLIQGNPLEIAAFLAKYTMSHQQIDDQGDYIADTAALSSEKIIALLIGAGYMRH